MIKKNGKPHDNVPLMEWACLSLWSMVGVVVGLDLEGLGKESVRSGSGEPLEQAAPDFIPAAVAEKVRKASILYSGKGLNFKTY